MVFCVLQTFLGLASLSSPDLIKWAPAQPYWRLHDSHGNIIAIEPGPVWKPAPRTPGPAPAAVLGKPHSDETAAR